MLLGLVRNHELCASAPFSSDIVPIFSIIQNFLKLKLCWPAPILYGLNSYSSFLAIQKQSYHDIWSILKRNVIHFFLSACFRTEQSTVEASLFAIINNDIMVLHVAQCIPGKWLYQFRFHRMLTWVYTLSGKIHYKKRHIYYFHNRKFYTTLHRIQFDGIQ